MPSIHVHEGQGQERNSQCTFLYRVQDEADGELDTPLPRQEDSV